MGLIFWCSLIFVHTVVSMLFVCAASGGRLASLVTTIRIFGQLKMIQSQPNDVLDHPKATILRNFFTDQPTQSDLKSTQSRPRLTKSDPKSTQSIPKAAKSRSRPTQNDPKSAQRRTRPSKSDLKSTQSIPKAARAQKSF